jgi:uncharacterized protein YlxW (UPF0749 family)
MEILLASVFLFLQSVIVVLLGINIKTTNAMNIKVTTLITWSEQHEKSDDERHNNEREDRRDLWGTVNDLKKKTGVG